MYFIGIIIFMFGFFVSMSFMGQTDILREFINPSMISFVLLSLIAVIMITAGFKTFISGLNAVFSRKYFINEKEQRKAVELFQLLSKTAIISSLIAVLLRLSALPHQFLEYDRETLSHVVSLIFSTPIHGLFVSIAILEPVVFILKHREK